MRGSRYSKEQIIGILKQGKKGVATAERWRQHGVSEGQVQTTTSQRSSSWQQSNLGGLFGPGLTS